MIECAAREGRHHRAEMFGPSISIKRNEYAWSSIVPIFGTTTVEPLVPTSLHLMHQAPRAHDVSIHPEVVEVASYSSHELRVLLSDGQVPMLSAPRIHSLYRPREARTENMRVWFKSRRFYPIRRTWQLIPFNAAPGQTANCESIEMYHCLGSKFHE